MRFNVLVVIAIVLLTLGTVAAQEPAESFEGYIGYMHGIRANAVKGEVIFQRDDAKYPVESGIKFEKGDFIRTASNAYAELLLQPGNYLRVAGDTELQIVNDEHDRMRLKLNRGTISLEILSRENLGSFYTGGYEARYLIRVITPGAGVSVSEPGVFRITAMSASQTELVVRNGSAVIKGQEVKAKRQAIASREKVAINDIDSKIEDAFDVWARERADAMVRSNKALKKMAGWSKKQKDGETSVDVAEEEKPSSSSLIVSAKPGVVSFVDDGVEVSRVKDEWKELKDDTHLETGDRVRTAENSFADIALFPDMNLRIRGGSEVMFEQLSNDGISIHVMNGSAILDVARFDRKKLPPITLSGPTTSVAVADSGNYRIDTSPNDTAPNNDEIVVRSGKVIFNGRSVGSCRSLYRSRDGDVVLNCDKNRTDEFDYWSNYRGEGEYYNGLSMAGFLAKARRVRFRNSGFWFQSPGETSYTFVPFTSELYRSPYGGNYSTALSPRRRPHRSNADSFRLDRLPSQQNPNQP